MSTERAGRSWTGHFSLILKGLCMGAADVVPGVSGGTMAFILGIYEELITAIRAFDLEFVKALFSLRVKEALERVHWAFLAAVGFGILTAIFTLARTLDWLLQNRPVQIWSFFFGLILGSIFVVRRYFKRWHPNLLTWIVLGMVSTYYMVGMMPAETPEAPWFILLSGAVAICAMILPGISGAFILVLLGKYHYVLEAVNNRHLPTIMIFAAGAAAGLMLFVRFLNWLLKRFHDPTIAILTGLMLGSLRKVWPWKRTLDTVAVDVSKGIQAKVNCMPDLWTAETAWAVLLIFGGFLLVLALEYIAGMERKEATDR